MPFYAANHFDLDYEPGGRYTGSITNGKGTGKNSHRGGDDGDSTFSSRTTPEFHRESSVSSVSCMQGITSWKWRAPLCLTSLPLDTLIMVLSYLTPHEILTLRRVSKRFQEASLQRIVWLDALRRLCAGRGIFGGTFPLSSMTLRQLEHAATTPARFAAMVGCDREERARMRVRATRGCGNAADGPPPGGGGGGGGNGETSSLGGEWEQEEEEAAAAARAPIRPVATRVLLPRTPRGKIQNALMMAATADFSSNPNPHSTNNTDNPIPNTTTAPAAAPSTAVPNQNIPAAPSAPTSYGVFETSYLVPGGRFLLTRTYGNLLQVWDLGWSAEMMVQPESVAAVHLGSGELQFDPDAQMSRDGEGLLVFVASENVFRIFEVQPLAPTPTFRKIASIDVVLGGRCVYVFTAEVIVYCMGRRVTVWNYRDDTIATWGVRLGRVWDIAIADKHVVLLDQNGFSVFRVPPLRPRTTETSLISAFAAPSMALAVANSIPGQQSMHQLVPTQTAVMHLPYPFETVLKVADNWSWYTAVSNGRPMHFDVLGVGAPAPPTAAAAAYGIIEDAQAVREISGIDEEDDSAMEIGPIALDEEEEGARSSLVVARYTLMKVTPDAEDATSSGLGARLPSHMPVLVEHARVGGRQVRDASVYAARSVRTGGAEMMLMWPGKARGHGMGIVDGRERMMVYCSNLGSESRVVEDAPVGEEAEEGEEEARDGARERGRRVGGRGRVAALELSGVYRDAHGHGEAGDVICCPFSGRVCAISDQGSIHVMDYVMPPPPVPMSRF